MFVLSAILSFLLFINSSITEQNVNFKIIKGSKLTISGTTNVKAKFNCECKENFYLSKYQMSVVDNPDTAIISFKNASIVIPTKAFVCENDGMTEDMHKALKADEFPTIIFNVISANIPKGNIKGATILADLVITGNSKKITIPLTVEEAGNSQYRFLGSKDILMTDFNITPPTAMLGLIKVKNNITINFDFKTYITGI